MNTPLVLVTGGAGFLGQAVVRRCLARGYRVRILGRTPLTGELASRIEFIRGDIGERATVDAAVKGCAYVFHVAAKAGVWGPWEDYLRINIDGTSHIATNVRANTAVQNNQMIVPVCPISGGCHSSIQIMPSGIAAPYNHGRRRPHLLCVRSDSSPMIGSAKASKISAAIMTVPTSPASMPST